MFNALGLRTTQSCEGHFGERELTPFVEVQPELPAEDEWFENDRLRDAVIKESLSFRDKALDLLSRFYADRHVEFDVMLWFSGIGYGFRIQSNGAETWKTLPPDRRARKLAAYQRELADFTTFLSTHILESAGEQ